MLARPVQQQWLFVEAAVSTLVFLRMHSLSTPEPLGERLWASRMVCRFAWRYIGAVLAVGGLGLAGCTCLPADEVMQTVPPKFVSWTVDGKSATTYTFLTGAGGTGQLPAATVRVIGRIYREGRLTADVRLEVPLAVGEYACGPTSPTWAAYEADGVKYEAGTAPGLTTAPGSGLVVVTEASDHHIAGTFTFTGVERLTGATKTITNGQFYVPQ